MTLWLDSYRFHKFVSIKDVFLNLNLPACCSVDKGDAFMEMADQKELKEKLKQHIRLPPFLLASTTFLGHYQPITSSQTHTRQKVGRRLHNTQHHTRKMEDCGMTQRERDRVDSDIPGVIVV